MKSDDTSAERNTKRGKHLPLLEEQSCTKKARTVPSDNIRSGVEMITEGLKSMFEGVALAENLEDDIVRASHSGL